MNKLLVKWTLCSDMWIRWKTVFRTCKNKMFYTCVIPIIILAYLAFMIKHLLFYYSKVWTSTATVAFLIHLRNTNCIIPCNHIECIVFLIFCQSQMYRIWIIQCNPQDSAQNAAVYIAIGVYKRNTPKMSQIWLKSPLFLERWTIVTIPPSKLDIINNIESKLKLDGLIEMDFQGAPAS